MNLIRKISQIFSRLRTKKRDFWYPITSFMTRSNIRMTPEQALRISAVMACVKVLAETIASLPLHVYKRTGENKDKDRKHALYYMLHTKPNKWQTSFEFREMMQGHLCLRGNAYAHIIYKNMIIPSELIPLHPDRITIERATNGKLEYIQRDKRTGEETAYRQEDIFHLRGLSSDGIKGLSPIEHAAELMGESIAAQRLSSSFFRNNAILGAALEHPQHLGKEALANLKESLKEEYGGSDAAYQTYILEEGMKWHEIGIKPEEGQFLETRKYQVTDIARIFRVPPHMIADLEKATFSNIEHQSIDFVTHTIRPWLVRWEQAIQRDLFEEEEIDNFAEFTIDGLLRGDSQARSKALHIQFINGAISQNEWRAIENRNPIPGGDKYYVPLNMVETTGGFGGTPKPGQGSKVLMPWIESTIDRIVSAEKRGIERWMSRTAHGTKFSEWLRDFYQKHSIYMMDAFAPILGSLNKSDYLNIIIDESLAAAIENYGDMSPAQVRSHIQNYRYRVIRDIVKKHISEVEHALRQ